MSTPEEIKAVEKAVREAEDGYHPWNASEEPPSIGAAAISAYEQSLERNGKVIVDRAALKRIQTADLANRDSEAYLMIEDMLRRSE